MNRVIQQLAQEALIKFENERGTAAATDERTPGIGGNKGSFLQVAWETNRFWTETKNACAASAPLLVPCVLVTR